LSKALMMLGFGSGRGAENGGGWAGGCTFDQWQGGLQHGAEDSGLEGCARRVVRPEMPGVPRRLWGCDGKKEGPALGVSETSRILRASRAAEVSALDAALPL